MARRVLNLIHKELLQLRRDRVLLAFLLLAPVLQLTLLARVTSQGIRDRPLAVLDMDNTAQTRRIVAALQNTETLTICCHPEDQHSLQEVLDLGQAELAVTIPRGFTRQLLRIGSTAQLQATVDGTNSIVATYALAAAEGALAEIIADGGADRGDHSGLGIDLSMQILYNPSLDSRVYTIPAQVGFIIYQVTLAVAAVGLAREREAGTLEQLVISPIRRPDIMAGKAVPSIVVGLLDYGLMFTLAITVFDVPMRGSSTLLTLLTLLFVITETTWGLTLSTLVRTQQQAVLLVFVQAMLDMTFSGYLVPVDSLPLALRDIANVVPMRHYLVLIRSIMLKGATVTELWPHILALLLLAALMALLATLNLSRHLE